MSKRAVTIAASTALLAGWLAMPTPSRAQVSDAQVTGELADPAGAGARRSPLPIELAGPAVQYGPRLADPEMVTRMEAQLIERAQGEEVGRVINGIVGLTLGAALFGSSIWLSVDDTFGFGTPNPAAITGFAIAPMLMAVGIFSFIDIGVSGDRLARWRAAMNGELTAVELGRFEGELRAEANAGRVARGGTLALAIGILVGGAATIVLGAALDGYDDEFRAIVIGSGAGFGLIGGIFIGTSFIESSAEQMWNRYQHGDAPETARFTIHPVLAPGAIGFSGTF